MDDRGVGKIGVLDKDIAFGLADGVQLGSVHLGIVGQGPQNPDGIATGGLGRGVGWPGT